MNNKRKSNGPDGDDRAAKRRKMPTDFRSMADETHESTTALGLKFLESIRRTADKHGRQVAGYFEQLLPRQGNEDYYDKIKMPMSLEIVEYKLRRQDFANMTELESHLKRMVTNAKEYYPRTSQIFEDAERVRKALSNYMTKSNPAYRLIDGYSATAAPIPPNYVVELAPPSIEQYMGNFSSQPQGADEDADGEDVDADADADAVADEDADGEEVEEAQPSTRRIVLKRNTSTRQPRGADTSFSTPVAKSAEGQYDGVSFNGLSFQQAQEKILDDLIRKQEDGTDWAYFEPFHSMPDKELKDYYQAIKEPMSLNKVLRSIKGMQGRGQATGITEFKSWAQFEQKMSLIWENAYQYNEDGSEISELATELKDVFHTALNTAKSIVVEPPQPKIKLKTAASQPNLNGAPMKIRLNLGGRRDSDVEPSAQAFAPMANDLTPNGPRNPFSTGKLVPVHPTEPLGPSKSWSVNGTSPSPAVNGIKYEEVPRQPPVAPMQVNGHGPQAYVAPPPPPTTVTAPIPNLYNGQMPAQRQQNGYVPAPHTLKITYDNKYRELGRAPLITNLCLRTPANSPDQHFAFNIPAHPMLTQQSVTMNLPPNQWKVQIVPTVSMALATQQRAYKMYVAANSQMLPRSIEAHDLAFEAHLLPGINTVLVQIIAALPNGETLASGLDGEFEKFTVLVNVLSG